MLPVLGVSSVFRSSRYCEHYRSTGAHDSAGTVKAQILLEYLDVVRG